MELVNRNEIFRVCDRHGDEIVTLGKIVTEYKAMLTCMVKFFKKFVSCGNKIPRVNSFHVFKYTNQI